MRYEAIRNVALVGHSGSGKTSLIESILFKAGITDRQGSIESGNTAMDFEPEEITGGHSVSTSLASFEHEGLEVNLIDTPGYADYLGEVISGLSAADAAVVVLSAKSGVEVQTKVVWDKVIELGLPRLIFINKMDKDGADYSSVLAQATEAFGSTVVPLNMPVGSAEAFSGMIDLIREEYISYDTGTPVRGPIPEALAAEVAAHRAKLLDAVIETDEDLLSKYLGGEELAEDEVGKAFSAAVATGSITAVMCGSAISQMGIGMLLTTIERKLPNPMENIPLNIKGDDGEDVSIDTSTPALAYVFKTIVDPFIGRLSLIKVLSGEVSAGDQLENTTQDGNERISHLYRLIGKETAEVKVLEAGDIGAVPKLIGSHTGDTLCHKGAGMTAVPHALPEPVFVQAIEPVTKGEDEKLSSSLHKLEEEDLTFKVSRDSETSQTLVKGLGEMQIESMLSKLKRKYSIEAVLSDPKVKYRETIKGKARTQGRHKKQSGGKGQFGDCWIEIEPLPRGSGFEFVDKIFGGSIPQSFRPAVEKGIRETMEGGVLTGNPVVDVKVTLVDGSAHSVDSSEMAFKIAGSMAFKAAVQQAKPVLLEPVLSVRITATEDVVGDIMGDLNSRRGKVSGMEPVDGGKETIVATIPEAEMHRYAIDLRSLTGGKATFTMEFDHYELVPVHIAQQLMDTHTVE